MLHAPANEIKKAGDFSRGSVLTRNDKGLTYVNGTEALHTPMNGVGASRATAEKTSPLWARVHQAHGNQAVLRMLNQSHYSSPGSSLQRKCACGSQSGATCVCNGGTTEKLTGVESVQRKVSTMPSTNRLTPVGSATLQRQADEEKPQQGADNANQQSPTAQTAENTGGQKANTGQPQYRELSEEELAAIQPVAQAATTPDGNAIGPTDAAHRGCIGNRFFFRRGTDVNTTTAAQGVSNVTSQLSDPPAEGADCSCGCGLFRQFIRGFWRAGSPTAAKQFTIGSCGTTITMNESTFTEEFVNCITGGAPIGPGCNRNQADAPGFASGLTEGTFVQMHLVLRYQMWDQCRGRSLGFADHTLDISGSNSPRTITFT